MLFVADRPVEVPPGCNLCHHGSGGHSSISAGGWCPLSTKKVQRTIRPSQSSPTRSGAAFMRPSTDSPDSRLFRGCVPRDGEHGTSGGPESRQDRIFRDCLEPDNCKTESSANLGASVASSDSSAVSFVDVWVLMPESGPVVEEVLFGQRCGQSDLHRCCRDRHEFHPSRLSAAARM